MNNNLLSLVILRMLNIVKYVDKRNIPATRNISGVPVRTRQLNAPNLQRNVAASRLSATRRFTLAGISSVKGGGGCGCGK